MADKVVAQSDGGRSWRRLVLLVGVIVVAAVVTLVLLLRPDRRIEGERLAASPGQCRGFNLLLVSLDTVRADRLGCYGYAQAETPTLDELAARGVRFANAITSGPLTLPAHSSLMTGLSPQNHGARANVIFSLPDRVETLAETLRAQGYRTGAVISAFVLDRRFGLAQGFDDYADDLTADGRTEAFGYRERIAEDTNRHALSWLDQHGHERFFLWVHYFDPHFPYAPPAAFQTRHQDRPYDGEIAYADAQLGQLLAAIDRKGIRDKTLIVVAGDHGESLGEHKELTHGLLIYDATLHVPMILSGPPPLPQGVVLTRQVGLIDVVPTVLSMLGVPAPEGLDGVSLLEPFADEPRAIYVETLWPKVMHNWSPLVGIRRNDVKFILAPTPELYDLQADPNELSNSFGQRPELAGELSDRLRALAGDDIEALAGVSGNLAVDEKTREKLAGLGYVVATSAPTTADVLPDPKDMMGHWAESQQGIKLANAGRHAEAVAVLEPYVHHNPKDIRAIGQLAECFMSLHRLDQAAAMFQRQADLAMRKVEPLAGLGLVRVQQGRLPEAEKAFQAALAEDPVHPAALFGQGLIASRRGQDANAMALFEKCIAAGRGTQTAPAYHNVGVLHERAGRRAEARRAFEQALALDSHYLGSAQALAQILHEEGRLDEAIRILRQAMDRHPAPDARLQLGKLLAVQGRLPDAVEAFRRVLAQQPDRLEAHYELGLALRGQGQVDEAIQHLARCVALNAKEVAPRLHLGVLLGQKGELDQAASHLREVTKQAPELSAGHYNLGVVLALQKHFPEAERAFAEAVRLDPKNVGARSTWGQVLLDLGRRDQAIAQFRRALEIKPDFEPAREGLRRAETQPAR